MYYVNREQIDRRLAYLRRIAATLRSLGASAAWRDSDVERLALERAVHVAAEAVTDVGSYMIDGFVMRDAGSYEDIIDILHGERAIEDELKPALAALVQWRKPLVQQYDQIDAEKLAEPIAELPDALERFALNISAYIEQELDGFPVSGRH